MIKNLAVLCALASVNAVKLQAEQEKDCMQFSATNVKAASQDGQVTVSFDAPSTEESAVHHYNVTVNGVEQKCDASPCTWAASDFDISNATTISATVKPAWKERFYVPFPIVTSNDVLVCYPCEDGQANNDDCTCPPPRVYEKDFCANEGQECSCDIGNLLWYGAGENWASMTVKTAVTMCDNSLLGDVAPGEAKSCLCQKQD